MDDKLPRHAPARNVLRAPGERRHGRAVAELISESVAGTADGVRFRIRGHCMAPLLRDGDSVTVMPLARPARVGDLLLARDPAEVLICHRLLALGPPLELAGDGSHRLDRVSPEAILGRVVSAHRHGRRLRLDRGSWQLAAPWLGRWHLLTRRHLGRPGVRWLEYPRLALLRVLALRWLLAGRRPPGDDTIRR